MKPKVPDLPLKGVFNKFTKGKHRLPGQPDFKDSWPVQIKYNGLRVYVRPMVKLRMKYVKKDRGLYDRQRSDFSRFDRNAPGKNKMVGARRDWLKEVSDPAKTSDKMLKRAGWSDRDIKRFREDQFLPPGYQVHHKMPLDDGGTNDSRNLVILRNDPEHKNLTQFQMERTRHLKPGESVDLDLPMPPPGAIVWPPG